MSFCFGSANSVMSPSNRVKPNDNVHAPVTSLGRFEIASPAVPQVLQRLQILHEVAFFRVGQAEIEDLVVVVDDIEQCPEPTVMEEPALLDRLPADRLKRFVRMRP